MQVHICPHSNITQSIWKTTVSVKIPRLLPTTYRRIHANLTQRIVLHRLYVIFVHLLLLPKSLEDFQQFFLLNTAFEVDSVHGQHFLDLLGAQFLQILQGLDLGEVD